MASPLILKIQAELERRGFDDVNRQIDRLKQSIRGLGDDFQGTERKSGNFLKGIVGTVVTVTAALLAVGIQQERVTAQLDNSFVGLGLNVENTTDAIKRLTREMAQNSLFSQGELRNSLSLLTRSTRSVTLAQGDALIAQELAVRNSISLEQASRALALALRGEGRDLANLIELGENEIEQLARRGALREELGRTEPIGEATARELNTISGAAQRFTNRAIAGFTELGEVVLGKVQAPISKAITFVDAFSEGVSDLLDDTIFKEKRAAEQALILGTRFDEINSALNLVGETSVKSFGNLQNAISSIDVALEFFNRLEGGLNRQEQSIVNSLEDRRLKLIEVQQTQKVIGQTSLRDQVDILRQLNLSSEDFQRQELENQFRLFTALKEADTLRGEDAIVNQQLVTNARLRLLSFERQVAIGNIREEVDARRRLFSLLQTQPEAIDETASIQERGRALDRLVESRKENLANIKSEKVAALALLELRSRDENLSVRQIENQRKIIEAETLAGRLRIERETEARATEIGDVSGRTNIRERTEGRINALRREQISGSRELNRERREEVLNARRLVGLEENLETLRSKGAGITKDENNALARISTLARELRENVQDAIIPTREEDVENFVTEFERRLDVPPININFNLSPTQIEEEARNAAIEVLEEQGFTVSRETTAPTGVDEEPTQ